MSGECNVCGQYGCVERNHCPFVGDNDHGDAIPNFFQMRNRIMELEQENYLLKQKLEILEKEAQ